MVIGAVVDLHCGATVGELAVVGRPRLQLDGEPVTALGARELLVPVKYELDRSACPHGQQRCDRLVISDLRFRAEAAANRHLVHDYLLGLQLEDMRQLFANEHRRLGGRPDVESLFRLVPGSDCAVRLHARVCLAAELERAANDVCAARHGRLQVAVAAFHRQRHVGT